MKKRILVKFLSLSVLLFSQYSFAIPNAQLSMDISVESVPRIALYYDGHPVTTSGIDFPMYAKGFSEKFEKTSLDFFLVGNVKQAEIAFADSSFVLFQNGGDKKMPLTGKFYYNGAMTDANVKMRIPVLSDADKDTSVASFKVIFSSDSVASDYSVGQYANTFTLILTPVI